MIYRIGSTTRWTSKVPGIGSVAVVLLAGLQIG